MGCETRRHTAISEAISIWRQCTSVNFYCTLHECGFTYSACLFPCFLQPTEEIKNRVSNMFRNDCCHTPPEDNSYCMSIKFFSRIKQKNTVHLLHVCNTYDCKLIRKIDSLQEWEWNNPCWEREPLYKIVLKKQMAAMRGNVLKQLL